MIKLLKFYLICLYWFKSFTLPLIFGIQESINDMLKYGINFRRRVIMSFSDTKSVKTFIIANICKIVKNLIDNETWRYQYVTFPKPQICWLILMLYVSMTVQYTHNPLNSY